MTSYAEIVQKLFKVNFHGGVKLGLENIEKLTLALGLPQNQFKCIHVAGTNGKGSVVSKIAEALKLSGYKVGLYTSPHISTFRERIQVNNQLITEKEMLALLPQVFNVLEREKIPATFFEIATTLAFLHFAHQKVDVAVIETGLGGRLDATNVVTPLLSVITSISLEHTEFLGHHIDEIAYEKGGIIKPNIPVLVGPRAPTKVLQNIAEEKKAKFLQLSEKFTLFDEENTSIAKRALELLKASLNISDGAIEKGILSKPRCRLEIYRKEDLAPWRGMDFPHALVFDVAHNPDGLQHLFEALKFRFPGKKLFVVFGLSKGKDLHSCMATISKWGTVFYPVVATNGRGVPVEDLEQLLMEFDVDKDVVHHCVSVKESVVKAMALAAKNGGVVVICGTFFIMSEARSAVGIVEPSDAFDTNEKMG